MDANSRYHIKIKDCLGSLFLCMPCPAHKKGSNLRLRLDRLIDANIKMEFSDIYELFEYLSHDISALALCSRSVVKSNELIELKTKEPLGMNNISVLIRKRDEKVRVIRDFMGVNLK